MFINTPLKKTDSVVLEGENITLRSGHIADTQRLSEYTSDPRVMKAISPLIYSKDTKTTNHNLLQKVIEPSDGQFFWVIDGQKSGLAPVLGIISLTCMDERRFNRDQSEVVFWVAPAFWNRGIASDALRTLLKANPQNSKTIFAEVLKEHFGSARVLMNAGFVYLGDAERYCPMNRHNMPTWTYSRKM